MNRHFGILGVCGFLAAFFLIGTVVLGLISLVRPEWVYYNVDNTVYGSTVEWALPLNNLLRWRGMFDVCLVDPNSMPANYTNSSYTILNNRLRRSGCVEIELNYADYYAVDDWRIIDMRRAHIALHIIGVFFGFVGLLYLLASLVFTLIKPTYERFRFHFFIAGWLLVIGVTFYFCAFLVFHNLMLKEKMAGGWDSKLDTVLSSSLTSKRATVYNFSSMYICAWTSLLAELMALFFLFVPAMCCTYFPCEEEANNSKVLHIGHHATYSGKPSNKPVETVAMGNLQTTTNVITVPTTSTFQAHGPNTYSMEITRTNPIQLETSSTIPRVSAHNNTLQASSSTGNLVPVYYQPPGQSPAGTLKLGLNSTPDAYIAVNASK